MLMPSLAKSSFSLTQCPFSAGPWNELVFHSDSAFKTGGVREVADGVIIGVRHYPFRDDLWISKHLCEGASASKAEMKGWSTTARSVVEPGPRAKQIAGFLVILYALVDGAVGLDLSHEYQVPAGLDQLSA
jgi:hypothetical protein